MGADRANRSRSGAAGRHGAGRQARRAHGGRRAARDGGGEAQIVPGSRAAGGIVRARLPLAHGGLPRSMTTASHLLAFLGLVVTLLIVSRQSWPARLRPFGAPSVLLSGPSRIVGGVRPGRGILVVAAAAVGFTGV